ncbi:MAG: hypothetical protein HYR88_06360 [Verrucomicrobia bacterium]|nr:hypothetical protein [Verrucomicrobiota bacterium]MBI3870342.1 hypothetical protein [Verrucomicrobiota bacterium]
MILRRIQWKAVLLSALFACCRASGDVRFDLFVGFDGHVPQGAWFPVTIEVQNDGPSFMGTIEIVERGFQGGLRRSMTLELPTGTLKRVTLPDFRSAPFAADWEAFLKDSRGRTVATATQSLKGRVPWGGLLVGSVSGSLAGAAILPPLIEGTRMQKHAASARILPHLLPDNPLALEGLRVLYINTGQALELKPAQAEAIARWVEQGGRLLVCVQQAADLSGLSWLRALLPALPERGDARVVGGELHRYALKGWQDPGDQTPFGLKPGAFEAIGGAAEEEAFGSAAIPVWDLKLRRDAKALLEAPGGPMVVSRRQGWGDVILLAFNPEREPFLSWTHRPWLWAALCGGKDWLPGFRGGYTSHTTDSVFGIHVDSQQIRKLPVGWLLILLIAYLAVIGPIDRWWLKKLRREMLTWITFPCYVVFFSLLIYWIGSQLRSGVTEWNELQMIDLVNPASGAAARTRHFGAVYSPANSAFRFGADEGVAAFRFEANERGGFRNYRTVSSQTGMVYSASAQVAVWTSQMFVNDGYLTNARVLRVIVEDQGRGDLMARFDNPFADRIEPAYLVYKEGVYLLAPIPPGVSESRIDRDRRLTSTALNPWMKTHAPGVERSANVRRRTFSMGDGAHPGLQASLIDSLFCASFPSRMGAVDDQGSFSRFQVIEGMDLNRFEEQLDCVLLGAIPGKAVLPQFARFARSRGHVDTVIRAVIPIVRSQEPPR